MDRFSVNVARAFIGKNVNLHLKDGSVIVNVQLSELQRDEFKREVFVKCVAYGKKDELFIPLRSIAWAEQLNLSLFLPSSNN